ncbi:MAG: histidine ammonia-lyase [Bdellovibrionales bacterium]
MKLILDGEQLNMKDVWAVAQNRKSSVQLAPESKKKMEHSRTYIEKQMDEGLTVYGVNTGFGYLSQTKIDKKDIVQLQKNLIRSHSVGIGDPFTEEETRSIMLLRANALARGHSGIRTLVVEKILEFLNEDVIPVIPQKGSVGASGDLAPLSHLALALIGEGQVWIDGKPGETAPYLQKKNIQPLELQAKEGLSLINGCQVMTGVGLLNAYRAQRICALADLAGAMTLEALHGSRTPFDPQITASRPHPGEAKTARNLLKFLSPESEIARGHADCDKVQDAYSLRCMPAVHGAVKDTLKFVLEKLEIEANSSTDNPLVFSESEKIVSCGNFHGMPIAFSLDYLAISLTALSSISERRIEKLINPALSGLPAFLTKNGGLNSGYMIVHVAAASLVSENKVLSHPASVDSIPTSADKEDHVSMGTIAARKLTQILKNTKTVVAMELMAACQGLDFSRPQKSTKMIEAVYALIRKKVPYAENDRNFSLDIKEVLELIENDELYQLLIKEHPDIEIL